MQQLFRILTIGWSPSFIRKMLGPFQGKIDISFFHGIVGNPEKVERLLLPGGMKAIPLSPRKGQALPSADLQFLSTLEMADVPSVRNMILGDRVLNELPPETALAYASLLGKRIEEVIQEIQPDLVLGTFDSLHSGMGLAVARRAGIRWVSMVYTGIPAGRTAFSTKMNPNALLPIVRMKDEKVLLEAQEILEEFRARNPSIYRAVMATRDYSVAFNGRYTTRLLGMHLRNLVRRFTTEPEEGRDPYTWPSAYRRMSDVVRRTWNSATSPKRSLIVEPPQGDFAYYPLHLQPESTVDNWAPFYQDQFALAKQVLRALPANFTLVIKLHFIDPDNYSRSQLKQLLKLPGVVIANPMSQSRRFLEAAKLVIGITGTACLEAALIGKPTLIFGDSPYQHFPNTERAKDVESLQDQIRNLIAKPLPSDLQIKQSLAQYISRFQYGSCSDWSKSPTAVESENLIKLFEKLVAFCRADTSARCKRVERTDETAVAK